MFYVTQSQSSPRFSAFRWLLETVWWYYIIVILGNCIAHGSVNSPKTIINDSEYSYLHKDCGVFSGSALYMQISPHVACVVPQLWLTPNITSGSDVMQKRTKEELSKMGLSRGGVIFFTQNSEVPLKALSLYPPISAGPTGVGLWPDWRVPAQLVGLGPNHTAALLGEEPCWLLWGRVTEEVTENSQGEPAKFAVCSLAALSTSFILHSSIQFKLWSFKVLIRTSGHFPNKSRGFAVQTGA